jgi:hypothetical protein
VDCHHVKALVTEFPKGSGEAHTVRTCSECTSDKKREKNAQRSAHVTRMCITTSQRPRRPSTWRKTCYTCHDNRRQGPQTMPAQVLLFMSYSASRDRICKLRLVLHVGSRHVHGWPPSDW